MPRAKENKLYRTFVKGLITEAGFLTYPEDASIDELNTVLTKKGNRYRRLGYTNEDGSQNVAISGYDQDSVTTEFMWKSAGNDSDKNFLVIQVGSLLHFFDIQIVPLSMGKKTFTVNLEDFIAPGASSTDVKNAHAQIASGKGFLFVAHEYTDPFSVEYDPDLDTINAVRIIIQMRDFDGVNDGLANDIEPTELSNEHHYNLRNQGWIAPGS